MLPPHLRIPLIIYLVRAHGFLFHSTSYNPKLTRTFCCSDCSHFGPQEPLQVGSCDSQHAPLLEELPYFWMGLGWAWGRGRTALVLVPQDGPGSSCIFSAPVLDSPTSARSAGFFYRKMVLRNKTQAPGVLVPTGAPLFPDPPAARDGKYVHEHWPPHTYACIYFCVYSHVSLKYSEGIHTDVSSCHAARQGSIYPCHLSLREFPL